MREQLLDRRYRVARCLEERKKKHQLSFDYDVMITEQNPKQDAASSNNLLQHLSTHLKSKSNKILTLIYRQKNTDISAFEKKKKPSELHKYIEVICTNCR